MAGDAVRPRRRRRWLRGLLALSLLATLGQVAHDLWTRHRLGAAHARWAASGAPTSLAELPGSRQRDGALELDAWRARLRAAVDDGEFRIGLSEVRFLREWVDFRAVTRAQREPVARLLAASEDHAVSDEWLAALAEELDAALARGVLPAEPTPARDLLEARAVEAAPLWEVARLAPRVGGTVGVLEVSRWFIPTRAASERLGHLAELGAGLPATVLVEADIRRAITDMDCLVVARELLAGEPTFHAALGGCTALDGVLRALPAVVSRATSTGDAIALDRSASVVAAFDPLGDLRAAASVERILGHFYYGALAASIADLDGVKTFFGDVEDADAWWAGPLLAVLGPVAGARHRRSHARFHRHWEVRLERLAREWWEPGSLAALGDPVDGWADRVVVRRTAAWVEALTEATRSEARRRMALCAIEYARGGEGALARALAERLDPCTGRAFERGVGEDGQAELSSPGDPPRIEPVVWPLPAR